MKSVNAGRLGRRGPGLLGGGGYAIAQLPPPSALAPSARLVLSLKSPVCRGWGQAAGGG